MHRLVLATCIASSGSRKGHREEGRQHADYICCRLSWCYLNCASPNTGQPLSSTGLQR